jgi:hypothetical protein
MVYGGSDKSVRWELPALLPDNRLSAAVIVVVLEFLLEGRVGEC